MHARMTRKLIRRIKAGELQEMLDLFAALTNNLIERIEHLEAQLATAERRLSKAPAEQLKFPRLKIVEKDDKPCS
jgi:hypothetical protein